MTVIATFGLEDQRFMISDLLISVEASPGHRAFRNLPAPIQRFNINLPRQAKYTITDVLQKTVRITDHFALAYAGDVAQAKRAIQLFRDRTTDRDPTANLFQEVVADLVRDGKANNLYLLGLIRADGGTVSAQHNATYMRGRKFPHLFAAGTGASDLLGVFASYRGKDCNRIVSPHEEGIALSLALSSYLLGKENVTGEPSRQAYGGMYEITYWNGNQFTRLDNVLHAHWLMKYEPYQGVKFNPPEKLQKVEYHNNVLYLRDLDLSQAEAADTVYIVTEPRTGSEVPNKPPQITPAFSYKWLVDHAYFLLPDGKVHYENRVRYVHNDNYSLFLSHVNNQMAFDIRQDHFDFIKPTLTELDSRRPYVP